LAWLGIFYHTHSPTFGNLFMPIWQRQ